MTAITDFFKSIKDAHAQGNATEHTHRPALKILLESLAQNITATNEPKRIACGAPDFILTQGQTPLGYVESKDVGKNLDAIENDEQLKRYRASLGNLILTDQLDFRWYVAGQKRMTARLGTVSGKNIILTQNGAADVMSLLTSFVNSQAPTISTPRELAQRMAHLARLICDTITRAFDEESEQGTLHQQMEGFQKTLLPDLDIAQFSDMYAQTIAYGLFAARCNVPSGTNFDRAHAAFNLPRTNPFLRKMFGHIAGPDLDERIVWAVDDLTSLLERADIKSILTDFGKKTKQEDPVVHFYETFLAAYDSNLRETRGVYYTPEPIVTYLVESVDLLLKQTFGLAQGLADFSKVSIKSGKETKDVHRVQLLDPATGTATFLYSIISKIHQSFASNQGMWSGYVHDHLLPRVTGFELLMAPYTVAHMKLGLLLNETGYNFATDERLRVFLTNTLDEADEFAGFNLFAQFINEEANAASLAKTETPVMVCIGNPPYSVSSQNKSEFIVNLLKDYKKGLTEKKTNLDDDFIKFIKFAQWRIEQTGYGILAFITNNSYIDGITHRRMRESLMETFDDIYILDLHGNSNKKEKAPGGGKDENVFDIQQGVAIGIFVKKSKKTSACTIRHAEMWGTRDSKYKRLVSETVNSTNWAVLNNVSQSSCLGTFKFFTPKAFTNIDEYCKGYSIKDIFPVGQNAIKTDRDELFYAFDKVTLDTRMKTFFSPAGLQEPFASDYKVGNSSSYDLLGRRSASTYNATNIRKSLYRPFDVRELYYSNSLTSRPAWKVMAHMVAGENFGLITTRQTADQWEALVTNGLCGHKSCAAYDISTIFPLYIYDSTGHLFNSSTNVPKRSANLSQKFIADFSSKLGMVFTPDGEGKQPNEFGPEDVFAYIFAVFHSQEYRSRYEEYLRIDYARVPLISNAVLFQKLCVLGKELIQYHILAKHGATMPAFSVAGTNKVENVKYTALNNLHGRVWINKTQYFEGVTLQAWEREMGGYQVAERWLKDRKTHVLSYDDILEYQKIVSVLEETLSLTAQIDAAINAAGGWPIS